MNLKGWLPDIPDYRDYSPATESVRTLLRSVSADEPDVSELPIAVDLREWCSDIEDQESIGSCTAHAGVGLIEFFQRKAFGKHIDASRLFLYKVTRNLLGWEGDTGAFLRDTMKAMVLFGVPPEQYWGYDITQYDVEPSAFCYAFAQSYQTIKYYRLDPPGTSRDDLMQQIWWHLACGLPVMFGFTVYSSIRQANSSGEIPFPSSIDTRQGGHAVMAVGYDDEKVIRNRSSGNTTTGALLIRNSWGTGWGDAGYGWLPYEYIHRGLAVDWWSLIDSEWVDTGEFGR
ncbi:MAG: hypothetical protein KDA88_11375 [Planctomycetaceae bacterium]|nr:hypothetical protein [Planctomycetaceae bacterium]MCB9952537.1 cysteine protease [Planctomycetaceae bacterium]